MTMVTLVASTIDHITVCHVPAMALWSFKKERHCAIRYPRLCLVEMYSKNHGITFSLYQIHFGKEEKPINTRHAIPSQPVPNAVDSDETRAESRSRPNLNARCF